MQNFWTKYKIGQIKPQFITVDIFDTLLYRKPQPEFYRFYKLSEIYCKYFKKYGFSVTPYFLFLQRNYMTSIIRSENAKKGYDPETTHRDIYSAVINDISKRQNINISISDKKDLLNKIIEQELTYEITQLKPNKPLLKILNNAKRNNIKIYFVTDMYLQSEQIKVLLKKLRIDVFHGGISSADTLYGKSSGRVFMELGKKYKTIDLTQSLHIGDQHRSDVRVPKQYGLQTIWYYVLLHRFILIAYKLIYKIYFKFIKIFQNRQLLSQQNSVLNTLFCDGPMNTKKEAEYIGWLFAPAIIYYLHYLATSSIASNSQVVFITGESKQFGEFYEKLGFSRYSTLASFNRTKLIRAYSSILYSKGVKLNSIISFTKKILRRKSTLRALATLGISNPISHQFLITGSSALRKDNIDKLNIDGALDLWRKDNKDILNSLKRSVAKDDKNITLADIGWNDTIQILLREVLLDSNDNSYKLSGMYLGRTGTNIFHPEITTRSRGIIFDSLKDRNAKYLYQPEIWESFLNLDNVDNPTRENIINGITQAIGYFNLSPQTADIYWGNNQSKLLKILRHPTKRMIEVMSNLQFDYGTVDEPICPLVNVSTRKSQVYKWLVFDRARFKSFYFHQGWKWGAATYYKFRIPYRVWRIKSKKPSF